MHIFINGWFSGQQTTGSGQYLYFLLPYLAHTQPDSQITLLIPVGSDPTFVLPLPANVTIQSEPLPSLPKNLAKLWWEQISVPIAARRAKADVLWIPYWAAPWWQPVPTVTTVHDVVQLILPAYRGGWLNRLYTSLVSHTARKCTSIITISHASKRDIVKLLRIPEWQVQVVYHGPNEEKAGGDKVTWEDNSQFTIGDSQLAIRAKYNLPDRYFLYLGGFDVRKNMHGMLVAYQRYLEKGGDHSVKMVIAGRLPRIDSDFMPDPKRIAGELGLAEQVHFCGWVDDADKATLYSAATAFVFPTHYEGFGMMILEAQLAGVPIISSL